MSTFIEIISSQGFIQLLSTFGLGVVLAVYFVFFYIPKKDKFWQTKYDELIKNYEKLRDNYARMLNAIEPETVKCTPEQGIKLADLGLDRDLYKLYFIASEIIDGRRRGGIGVFIAESIRSTSQVWSKFRSPFQNVPRIGDLYGVYTSNGESLKDQLEEMLKEDIPNDDKKDKIWEFLRMNTENMKREFQQFLDDLKDGKEVTPYYAKT